MDVPALVTTAVGDEEVDARVDLGGGDAVFVTPSRTLVYRAEGLLTDESVEEFPHDVERLELTTGRRKAKLRFVAVAETRSFAVPADRTDAVLAPVLGGVLRAAAALDSGEAVRGVFRFSDLTLVVADGRAVKHVGRAVWDPDGEVLPFADLTGLHYEEGQVATQVVLELEGRPHRVKVPKDAFGRVRQTVESAVLAFHEVDTLDALAEKVGLDEPEDGTDAVDALVDGPGADAGALDDSPTEAGAGSDVEGSGDRRGDRSRGGTGGSGDEPASAPPDLGLDLSSGHGSDRGTAETSGGDAAGRDASTGPDPASADGDVAARLAALEAALERQREELAAQRRTIERLVDELRRGR